MGWFSKKDADDRIAELKNAVIEAYATLKETPGFNIEVIQYFMAKELDEIERLKQGRSQGKKLSIRVNTLLTLHSEGAIEKFGKDLTPKQFNATIKANQKISRALKNLLDALNQEKK